VTRAQVPQENERDEDQRRDDEQREVVPRNVDGERTRDRGDGQRDADDRQGGSERRSEGGILQAAGGEHQREDRVVELEAGEQDRQREHRHAETDRRSTQIADQFLDEHNEDHTAEDEHERRTDQSLVLDPFLDHSFDPAFTRFAFLAGVLLGDCRPDRPVYSVRKRQTDRCCNDERQDHCEPDNRPVSGHRSYSESDII